MQGRKGLIEISTLTALLGFLSFMSTGVYNLIQTKLISPEFKQEHINIKKLQDKYCRVINPTPEQQEFCIEILQVSIPEK